MALPLATLTELAAYLQRDDIPEESGSLALTLASGKVRAYIARDLPILIDATTATDDVKSVVLAVAGRIVMNPGDARQETAGAQSITYASETIGVQLTRAERDDLRVYRPPARAVALPLFREC